MMRSAVEFESAETVPVALELKSLACFDRFITINELKDIKLLDRYARRLEKKQKKCHEKREEKRKEKEQKKKEFFARSKQKGARIRNESQKGYDTMKEEKAKKAEAAALTSDSENEVSGGGECEG